MCDCFPKTGGSIRPTDTCFQKLGNSEYANSFKQSFEPVVTTPFRPPNDNGSGDGFGLQRYSFSRGARFGIPPYCDCTPPPQRFRFETTYQHDFFDMHHDSCVRDTKAFPGVKPRMPFIIPKQYLCPFTTESTYSRAFDMPQAHYKPICAQQDSCGQLPCDDDDCYNPCGMTIRFSPQKPRPCVPKLRKEDLIKPGTDTSSCCECPIPINCNPCTNQKNLCDACCGCEYPCKLHQATTTPTRKYPIKFNVPRYVPDPRVPLPRPKLLCSGGTLKCPLQNQFPTQAAIKQARERLICKLEEERNRFPPEAIESTYRSTFKTPPVNESPQYCSAEMKAAAEKADKEYAARGSPPPCIPQYCLDGGPPPDPRPLFDHMSTYGADYVWNVFPRFKILGGELPCGDFPIKPLYAPKVVFASELIDERTEEKERWGKDWECVPEPPEPLCC